jgi:hypothetical protein
MVISRKTCRESAEIITVLSAFANQMATEVFPTAVGPAITMSLFADIRRNLRHLPAVYRIKNSNKS